LQKKVIAGVNSSAEEEASIKDPIQDESAVLSSVSAAEASDKNTEQKSSVKTTVTENTSETEIAPAVAATAAAVSEQKSEPADEVVKVSAEQKQEKATSKTESVPEATAAAVIASEKESETVDEVIAVNAEDNQDMTPVEEDLKKAESQKVIAMDVSGTAKTLEDGTDDFQSKKPNDVPIHINTIYFDFDKYNIRFDARIELDKIAVVLKQNPQTKIKVNAHTDIRGKKGYNLKLSNNRAYNTVQYLLDKGIEVERISGEGYGETQVAEICTKEKPCTGLQHQLNRRSEFLIVDKFSDAVIAQSVNKAASGNYAVNSKVPNSGAYLNYDFSDDREVYTVQLGAFKGDVQNNKFNKLTDLFNYRYDDGLNRYYAGIFESSSEARNHMKKMRKNGFEDAFVVGLKGESRF